MSIFLHELNIHHAGLGFLLVGMSMAPPANGSLGVAGSLLLIAALPPRWVQRAVWFAAALGTILAAAAVTLDERASPPLPPARAGAAVITGGSSGIGLEVSLLLFVCARLLSVALSCRL